MKMEDEPPSKKYRKDDDERVQRAALLMIKSKMLSVPQVRNLLIVGLCESLLFRRLLGLVYNYSSTSNYTEQYPTRQCFLMVSREFLFGESRLKTLFRFVRDG